MPGEGLLKRHKEVCTALRFFLDTWYKHKQAGTVADSRQVLNDYIRFKGLGPVLQQLRTEAPQVFKKERRPQKE